MKFRRFAVAAVLAPLALPVTYLILKLADFGYLPSHSNYFEKSVLEFLIVTVSSYAVSYAFGAPVLLMLTRFNRLSIAQVLVSAFVCGVVAGLGFSFWAIFGHAEGNFGVWTLVVICLLCACAAFLNALLFCTIAGVNQRARD